jgi:hypothetical protein
MSDLDKDMQETPSASSGDRICPSQMMGVGVGSQYLCL